MIFKERPQYSQKINIFFSVEIKVWNPMEAPRESVSNHERRALSYPSCLPIWFSFCMFHIARECMNEWVNDIGDKEHMGAT